MSARMLMACRACGRQYDVSHLRAGSRVRCECGAVFAAQHVVPHAPRVARCSSCAAPLPEGASACSFCGSGIPRAEWAFDSLCPFCYARAMSGARHCVECGVAFAPQAIFALPDKAACPRCRGALFSRSLGEQSVIECPRCGGLFLKPEHFERLTARADERRSALTELGRRPAPEVPDAAQDRVMYLPCPVCPERMVRKNFGGGSGVILDLCRDHGVWLDHRELEKILSFVESGGLQAARARELERFEEEAARARAARLAPPAAPLFDEPRRGSLDVDLVQLVEWLGGLFHRSRS